MEIDAEWQPEVVARYLWTAQELIHARQCHMKHLIRKSIRVAIRLLIGFFIIGVIIGLANGPNEPSLWVAVIFLSVWFLFLNKLVQRWLIRYQFSKRPDKDKEIEWQFGREAVAVISNHSNAELSWSAFSKAVHSSTGLLLYPNDQIFHWMPRHAFASQADFDHAAELARAKIQRFYEVE